MENLEGMEFNAVSIEHSFASFLGKAVGSRGGPHDADVFRMGRTADLGRLLDVVADRFEQRVQRIVFSKAESQRGCCKAKIESAIGSLRDVAIEMKRSKNRERDDYHWLIIGPLVLSIDALLEHAGV